MSSPHFAAHAPAVTESFCHEAFLYSGEASFLAGVMAFIHGALDVGEAVLIAVAQARAALLRRVLGRDAEHVAFFDVEHAGRNPARIIPAWQDWADRNMSTGRGFRGIGEPVWAGRGLGEITEGRRHEQLLNTAFNDGPGWWLLCPYDVDALPAAVVEYAYTTHPSVIADGIRQPSAGYAHDSTGFPALSGELPHEPTGSVWEFAFDMGALGRLRDYVAEFAGSLGDDCRTDDAVLVVSELAANSIKYGGGAGVLRLWSEGGDLICEVRDNGLITDPLAGRRRPTGLDGKAGLWIANQVSDLLQIRSAPESGTVVRARISCAPEEARKQ